MAISCPSCIFCMVTYQEEYCLITMLVNGQQSNQFGCQISQKAGTDDPKLEYCFSASLICTDYSMPNFTDPGPSVKQCFLSQEKKKPYVRTRGLILILLIRLFHPNGFHKQDLSLAGKVVMMDNWIPLTLD